MKTRFRSMAADEGTGPPVLTLHSKLSFAGKLPSATPDKAGSPRNMGQPAACAPRAEQRRAKANLSVSGFGLRISTWPVSFTTNGLANENTYTYQFCEPLAARAGGLPARPVFATVSKVHHF